MRAKPREIKQELRQRMHQPIREQGKWLKQVAGGYFRYHGVPTSDAILLRVICSSTPAGGHGLA
jgi:RNA-directed DNA polymerase